MALYNWRFVGSVVARGHNAIDNVVQILTRILIDHHAHPGGLGFLLLVLIFNPHINWDISR